jgi:hypothetical protein
MARVLGWEIAVDTREGGRAKCRREKTRSVWTLFGSNCTVADLEIFVDKSDSAAGWPGRRTWAWPGIDVETTSRENC